MSLTTGYAYPRTVDSEADTLVHNFLSTVWDDDMRAYVLRTLAASLCGQKRSQDFNIWTGAGGNGKSTVCGLLEAACGGYYKALSVGILTRPVRDANAAQPELATCRGVRVAVCTEPEARDQLQVGIIKTITGGDLLTVRPL